MVAASGIQTRWDCCRPKSVCRARCTSSPPQRLARGGGRKPGGRSAPPRLDESVWSSYATVVYACGSDLSRIARRLAHKSAVVCVWGTGGLQRTSTHRWQHRRHMHTPAPRHRLPPMGRIDCRADGPHRQERPPRRRPARIAWGTACVNTVNTPISDVHMHWSENGRRARLVRSSRFSPARSQARQRPTSSWRPSISGGEAEVLVGLASKDY